MHLESEHFLGSVPLAEDTQTAVADPPPSSRSNHLRIYEREPLRAIAIDLPIARVPDEAPARRPIEPIVTPFDGTQRRWYPPLKLIVEWIAAGAIALLSLPVVVLCCALVKLTSPGPAIYRQRRVGRSGRIYTIYKIRTMRNDSEAKSGPVWATQNDVRITRLGHFLRDTHLDELPQAWNVLLGHMSLIGPRPERPEITARLEAEIPFYQDRLRVRPGVTGLAQMRLPADLTLDDVKRKVSHDLYYVAQMNPWLDVRIALCTEIYFFQAAAKAICDALVGKYGRAVEQRWAEATLAAK